MIYLILIFTILFFILAWRRLDWAVVFLIAALPAYLIRFKIVGLPSTLLEVMIWAVFFAWLAKNYRQIFENVKFKISNLLKIEKLKIKNYKRYPFDWEIVMLLLVALAAVAIGGFSNSAFGIWKAYFFEPALFFIVAVNLIVGKQAAGNRADNSLSTPNLLNRLELILWPLAAGALAVSLLAIYQKLTGNLIDNPLWAAAGTRRVVSFFGYPNAVGLYLGPIILVMMGWLISIIKNFQFSIFNFQTIFNKEIFKTTFIVIVLVLSTLSIYFAKSKGALAGVAAGLVIFGLLAGKKIRWLTVAVVIIVIMGIAAYQPARDLALANLTLVNKSGQIRQAGWRDSWRMLKDGRVVTGAGLANYQVAVQPYHTEGIFIKDYTDPEAQRKLVYNETYRTAHWQPLEIYLYPHNLWLNFWSELGLAGLLLFCWIIGKYLCMGILNLKEKVVIAAPEPKARNVMNSKNWIPGQARNDKLVLGLICAMVVILVHGWVDVPYFKNDLAVMFWLFLAMMGLISLVKINSK